MIRKLRLKWGSSAHRRCVRLCWRATTAIWQQRFWQFPGLWSQNAGSEGCDRTLIPRTGRSDTSARREDRLPADRLSQSYRRRGKNCPGAFPLMLLFQFLLSPKHYLRLLTLILWWLFLSAVNVGDVWSFFSAVTYVTCAKGNHRWLHTFPVEAQLRGSISALFMWILRCCDASTSHTTSALIVAAAVLFIKTI